MRKLLKVMNMCVVILIVVMVPQVYAYIQTHQVVCNKYVHFLGHQLHLNKAAKKVLWNQKADLDM